MSGMTYTFDRDCVLCGRPFVPGPFRPGAVLCGECWEHGDREERAPGERRDALEPRLQEPEKAP